MIYLSILLCGKVAFVDNLFGQLKQCLLPLLIVLILIKAVFLEDLEDLAIGHYLLLMVVGYELLNELLKGIDVEVYDRLWVFRRQVIDVFLLKDFKFVLL